jgi:NCS1 family nucleobase:cation symporter-1
MAYGETSSEYDEERNAGGVFKGGEVTETGKMDLEH